MRRPSPAIPLLAASVALTSCAPPPEVTAARLINGLSHSLKSEIADSTAQGTFPEKIECPDSTFMKMTGKFEYKGTVDTTTGWATVTVTTSMWGNGPGISEQTSASKLPALDCTAEVAFRWQRSGTVIELVDSGVLTDCTKVNCKVYGESITCASLGRALRENPCP